MKASKDNILIAIYVTPAYNEATIIFAIIDQYEFKDVFKKKNVNILLKHHLYNCAMH